MELTTLTQSLGRPVQVELGGEEPETWVVRPRAITPATQRRLLDLRAAAEAGDPELKSEYVGIMATLLSQVVVSWTITQEGDPVPVTPEALEQLGDDLLEELFGRLTEAMAEGPKGPAKPSTEPSS